MWRNLAWAVLLTGWVFGAVPSGEASSISAPTALPELVSPYQQYELKLRVFLPAPRCPAGVLLPVRINGGRPLRLLLDSGAEFIVVGAKAARSVGLAGESQLDLVGLESRPARVGRAETVEIDSVSFRNCRVAFVNGKVLEGADGVIPLSLFSQFLLRLDLPGKTLVLIPYPGDENAAVPPARGLAKRGVLLVATVLNGKQNGYVIMDTGAFCSAVSRQVARTLGGSQIVPEVRVAAGTGAATGRSVSSPVHFAVADQDLIPNEVVALDLSNLSRRYGVEVLGVLGFPALNPYVLTIDYRNGRVKIEPPQNSPARELHGTHAAQPSAPLAFR